MLSVFDFIRAAAVVIGVGYNAQQDRKAWIWGDSVLWGAYALGHFIFPSLMFPGHSSPLLSYVTRVFAAYILGMETMWYLTRKTRDDNVVGATLWTRLICSLFVLLMLVYSYIHKTAGLSDKTVFFDMLALTMLFLTSIYQFWRGGYRAGGREQKGNVSTLLRIIFLIMFVTGLLNMTFTSWVLPVKSLTKLETLMVKCVGALLIGGSFTPLYATSFRFDEDRRALFLSQIVALAFSFISLNLAYFVDGLFDPQQTLMLHYTILPAILVLLGLYLLWEKKGDNQSDYNLRSRS